MKYSSIVLTHMSPSILLMADPQSSSPSGLSRRRSNHDRARWRDTCRKDLTRHLKQQLGFDVDPAEVRLVPGPTDPYVWRYGPEQEHLFRKQLSKHNLSTEHMSALQELEAENQSLAARLDMATSMAEERNTEIQRLQESKDAMEQRLRELQATIQLRDAEALRRTQLVAEYMEKEHATTVLLQGWERGLRTLQVEVGTALQTQTSVSKA
ncbi:hypothetical protein LTR24_007924 [Lithohypha guttulata]|uniref:Uncharacterized protein n=1 Tax=Lithohypha guttulata TaxID=1690604 RepID=A0ABR0K1E3_9EURO|nr:hypothetical protein LTR24_007924 [Lithohypha guttulata]